MSNRLIGVLIIVAIMSIKKTKMEIRNKAILESVFSLYSPLIESLYNRRNDTADLMELWYLRSLSNG